MTDTPKKKKPPMGKKKNKEDAELSEFGKSLDNFLGILEDEEEEDAFQLGFPFIVDSGD